jgi:hypothetical protein
MYSWNASIGMEWLHRRANHGFLQCNTISATRCCCGNSGGSFWPVCWLGNSTYHCGTRSSPPISRSWKAVRVAGRMLSKGEHIASLKCRWRLSNIVRLHPTSKTEKFGHIVPACKSLLRLECPNFYGCRITTSNMPSPAQQCISGQIT